MAESATGSSLPHLALEKALKALVCRQTNDLAPRIHNLLLLAELAGLTLSPGRASLLGEMNQFAVEARYPELLTPPSPEKARDLVGKAGKALTWLQQL